MIATTLKPKSCKACGETFQPVKRFQKACSIPCSIAIADQVKQKKERKEDKIKKLSLRTKSDFVKLAQISFNKYVRTRDAGKSCICCDKPLAHATVGGGFDCGHYRSVGSAPHLRFNPDNAHGQTKQCNRYGAGRAVDYRLGLIARIGLERVETLEANNTPAKWSFEDLITIRLTFDEMTKQLLKAQA